MGYKSVSDEELENKYKKLNNYIYRKDKWIRSSTFLFLLAVMVIMGDSVVQYIQTTDYKSRLCIVIIFAVALVNYAAAIIYFIIKDPSNNINKLSVRELLYYCSKADSYVLYCEYKTYLSYKVNRWIRQNGNQALTEPNVNTEQIISHNIDDAICRMISTIFKENNNKVDAFKSLCKSSFGLYSDLAQDDKQLESTKNKIYLTFDKAAGGNSSITKGSKFKKIKMDYILQFNIIVNIVAILSTCIGMFLTAIGRTPIDTFIYAIVSLALCASSIVSSVKNAKKEIL